MRQTVRSAWFFSRLSAVVAVCLTGLATCITGAERDYVKYDAGADKFDMLMVLTDLNAKEQDDLEFLAGLYKNRDHWIAPAIPGGMDVTPLLGSTLIRTGNHQYSPVNVFTSRPDKFESTATTVSLDDITVTPGEFFGDGKSIGYYQAISVPGKVIDGALAETSQSLLDDDLATAMSKEVDGRKDGTSKKTTWAAMKEKVLATVTLESPPAAADGAATQASDSPDLAEAMEDESLNNLLAAIKGKTLAIVRDKRAVKLVLPMTAADAAGAVDLEKAVVAKAATVAATPETDANREKLVQMRSLVALGKVATLDASAKGLTISLDLVNFASAMAALPNMKIDLNSTDKDSPKKPDLDLAGFLKEQKIPVDGAMTAEQVVKDFQAGTLKGHPSEKAVAPGEGIAKPAGQ